MVASNSHFLCEQDSVDIINAREKAFDLYFQGEYTKSALCWEKHVNILEQTQQTDVENLAQAYQIMMGLASKAEMYSTEAKYAQKYGRLSWPHITSKELNYFERNEKIIINALMEAKDNDGALLEISYADSCLSTICSDISPSFRLFLSIKRHIINTRYDLAYRESLELLQMIKNDANMAILKKEAIDDELCNDLSDIADIFAKVCEYEKAINIIQNIMEMREKQAKTEIIIDSKKLLQSSESRKYLIKMGDIYLLAKKYQQADYYYNQSYSLNILRNKSGKDENGDAIFDFASIYDENTSDAFYKMSLVKYKVGDIKLGDQYRDSYLNGIKTNGKRFIGEYDKRLCFLNIVRFEALHEYDEAIKYTKDLIEKNVESFGDLHEYLALLYLRNNQAEEAFSLSTEIIKQKRNYLLNNLETLSMEEKAILWNGNSEIFKIQKLSSTKCANSLRESILFDDVALFSKGLLLTVSANPNYKCILQTSWKNIQKRLKSKELAIEFLAVDRIDENSDSTIYVAIVIDKTCKQPRYYNLCVNKDLEEHHTLKELYNLIWSRLGITDRVKNVYFSADGLLHTIPLEAALQNSSNKDTKVYRLTSTRELVNTHNNKYKKQSVLYGGLEYNDNYYKNRPLPFSKSEVNTINGHLKRLGQKCIIYQGNNGTCESLLSLDKHNLTFLHMATHGYVESRIDKENSMMHSGLVMSDRKITSEEISKMHFNGIKLVVLSACGSGLGEITNGEGVFGLQRAFKLAGATSILMTLWDIRDDDTKVIMDWFYTKICQGKSFQEALHETQMELKNYYVPGYGKPYSDEKIWSGFVLLDAID